MTVERVPYTQAGRMMAIATPLGADVLLLDQLAIDERIDHLFEVEAEVKAQRDDLAAGDLVGATVDFSLQLKDGGTRYWNGFVTAMHEGPLTTRGTRNYAMTVRPKLWVLSQKSDCRIFLNQTSPQIVETLCKEHDISDLDLRITGKPTAQDYSVQWNETDLHYLRRRMEEDGLFFWFEHQQGKHTLVVADHYSGYRDADPQEVRYTAGSADQDRISDWRRSFAFTPGKRAGRDWNFLTMSTPEATQTTFAAVPGNAQKELYEFPGRFADTTGAEQMMKNRIQASETGFETVDAASTVRTLGPGQKFTPFDTAKPENVFDPQVVIAIRHSATDPTYETGTGQPAYTNTFEVMPATTAATPHRTIPRPKIIGSQIALIAGPSGEEIFTDPFGRVKVWFPWDRRATKDGSDTCWIRVGQPWAGGTWGYQTIPRVGMEALISYQEGDPDRPFVLALVPDTTNKVPWDLPANKSRTVIRTDSYKGDGFNELYFEDYSGREEIYTHAQRDMNTHVENNKATRVDVNQSESIGNNKSINIGNSHYEVIGGDMTLMVGPNITQPFTLAKFQPYTPDLGALATSLSSPVMGVGEGNYVVGIGKNKSETVLVSSSEVVGAAKALTVGGGYQITVGGIKNESVAIGTFEEVGQTKVTVVGHKYEIVCGKAKIILERDGTITFLGEKLTIDTKQQIDIKSKAIDFGETSS